MMGLVTFPSNVLTGQLFKFCKIEMPKRLCGTVSPYSSTSSVSNTAHNFSLFSVKLDESKKGLVFLTCLSF